MSTETATRSAIQIHQVQIGFKLKPLEGSGIIEVKEDYYRHMCKAFSRRNQQDVLYSDYDTQATATQDDSQEMETSFDGDETIPTSGL